MTARPIRHPDTQQALIWDDVETWWCFDCLKTAESYFEIDGHVRCADCKAKWAEHADESAEWVP